MLGFASNSSRATTFGLAALGALAITPSFSNPSNAESADAVAARAIAVCVKYKDPASHAQCAYDALGRATSALKRDTAIQQRRGAEADRRGAEAEKRSAAADKRSAEADTRYQSAHASSQCTDFLIAGVKGGTFTKSAVLTFAKGKLTADNACEVARGFGYSQKAELDRPAIR